MTGIKSTAAERLQAALRAIGAVGYWRDLTHAQVAYSAHAGRMWIVLDENAWDESADDLADLTPAWLTICQMVKAAGSPAVLDIPGDDELLGIPAAGLMGKRHKGILSWIVDVPGVPFMPEAADAYLVPESPEVTRYAERINAAEGI